MRRTSPPARSPAPTLSRGCRGRLAAAALALLLAGCGFRPLYGGGETGAVAGRLAGIEVAPIPNRVGQEVRNRLLDRLAPDPSSTDARYRLDVQLGESLQELAVRRTGFATRRNLRLTATYTLTDKATGAPVVSGSTRAVSSYNVLKSDFSTLIADNDARSRAAVSVAEQIHARLAVHFAQQADSASGVAR